MTTGKETTPPATEPEEIRAEIERTRNELGDSVEALAAKADVKARTQEAVAEAKTQAKEAVAEATTRAKEKAAEVGETVRRRPMPVAGALAGITVGVVIIILVRRRRAARARVTRGRWQAR